MDPKIAICTHMVSSLDVAASLVKERDHLAIDYSINEEKMLRLENNIRELRKLFRGQQIEIRYHGFFKSMEIGHCDEGKASLSLGYMKLVVDAISRVNGKHLTVHIGLNSSEHGELNLKHARDNLKELVEFGCTKGVKVCLENLKKGPTSEPEQFLNLVQMSGANVTFDIGHAISSDAGKNGVKAHDFIQMASPHIVNAHVYEAEEDCGHIAPQSNKKIKLALKALSATSCDWWVVELGDSEDIRRTIGFIQPYISH